jgi:dTDP-4-dehydrorhamnose 3,5-epimerase
LRFLETGLAEAFVIDLDLASDERGFFARSFCEREFESRGLASRFVQCNVSFNHKEGTIRGMHWQAEPNAEAKLVRCTSGAIFDVIVDLRRDSKTRMQVFGTELSSQNRRMLFIPAGFAHGFQSLCDDSEVFYQMSEFYAPKAALGFRWNDPEVGIRWPRELSVISDHDRSLPLLSEVE